MEAALSNVCKNRVATSSINFNKHIGNDSKKDILNYWEEAQA